MNNIWLEKSLCQSKENGPKLAGLSESHHVIEVEMLVPMRPEQALYVQAFLRYGALKLIV